MEKLTLHSPDLTQRNVDKLLELFPTVVTEALDEDGNAVRAVDFDLLRQELSDHIVEGPQERYHLDWPGKRAALFAANAPIAKTLRPVREESVDFDTTKNLFIEGDNLEALKMLQESYVGKVKLIYIDPPYNTGNDFLYADGFSETTAEYLAATGQTSDSGQLVANPESSGRFHSIWLSMMYPRLKLARNLLKQDGVLFVSIGPGEVANLTRLVNEIFGRDNVIGLLTRVAKTTSDAGRFFAPSVDYIIVAARDANSMKGFKQPLSQSDIDAYTQTDGRGRYKAVGFYQASLSLERSRNARYFIDAPDGSMIIPPPDKRWRTVRETFEAFIAADEIVFKQVASSPLQDEHGKQSKWNVYTKQYLDRRLGEGRTPRDFLTDVPNHLGSRSVGELDIPFDFPKPPELIRHLLNIASVEDGDIVLDYFAGSCTTAHAVMAANASDGGHRHFVMVQLAEPCDPKSEASKHGFPTVSALGMERIRRAGAKLLAATPGWHGDAGFRVLRVDTPNLNDVLSTPEELAQSELGLYTDNLKSDRTGEDLLVQVLLDWGLELTMPITSEVVDGKQVFIVEDDALVACFADVVSAKIVSALAERQPLRAVFRDSGFATDADRINAEQIFAERSPTTHMKSI